VGEREATALGRRRILKQKKGRKEERFWKRPFGRDSSVLSSSVGADRAGWPGWANARRHPWCGGRDPQTEEGKKGRGDSSVLSSSVKADRVAAVCHSFGFLIDSIQSLTVI
jgi:hypothetical protein